MNTGRLDSATSMRPPPATARRRSPALLAVGHRREAQDATGLAAPRAPIHPSVRPFPPVSLSPHPGRVASASTSHYAHQTELCGASRPPQCRDAGQLGGRRFVLLVTQTPTPQSALPASRSQVQHPNLIFRRQVRRQNNSHAGESQYYSNWM